MHNRIFLNRLQKFLIIPLTLHLIFIKIFLLLRHKRCIHLLQKQLFPTKLLKPNMFLNFQSPIKAQSTSRASLYQLIDKINTLIRPSIRHIRFSKHNLSLQNPFSHLLSIPSIIRSRSFNTFIQNYP